MAAPSSITQITNHQQAIQDRLLQQFKERVTIPALVAVFGQRAQVLENALWSILTQRFFSGNPVGQQLDNLGKLMNVLRNGATDVIYTKLLQAQILLNLSNGTITDIDRLFALVADVGSTIAVLEYFPAGLEVRVGAVPQSQPITLGALLQSVKSAGIAARLVYNTDTDANSFTVEASDGYFVGATIGGATSFQIAVADAATFPPTGSVSIAKGTTVQETVSYSAINYLTGVVTCSAMANAHAIGDAIGLTTSAGSGIDASSVGQCSGSTIVGATSLPTSASGFAGTGTIIIAKGTAVEETVAYTAFVGGTFTIAAPGLAFAHVSGDLVQLSTPVGGKLTGVY